MFVVAKLSSSHWAIRSCSSAFPLARIRSPRPVNARVSMPTKFEGAAMKRIAVTGAFILAVGIGVDVIGRQAASAQQATDLRVADLVRAGKVRVGLGLGVPTVAIKDPATGEVRGPALELGR